MKLLLALLCLASQSVMAQTLRVGYFNIAPHAYFDGASHWGAAIEFFARVTREMNVTSVEFTAYPQSRLLLALERGQIDAILFLAQTPERDKMFAYAATPYAFVESGIAVRMASPLKEVKGVNDLLGLSIGTTQDGLLTPIMRAPGLNLVPVPNVEANVGNLKKLSLDRIDAFYQPDLNVIRYEAKRLGMDAQLRFLRLPEKATPIYTVFSKSAATTYLAAYQKSLNAVLATTSYANVLDNYIKRSRREP